jgi:alkyl hydroperoxide reductase subunit AhpC
MCWIPLNRIIIDETAAISKSFGLVRPNERRYIRALTPSSMIVVVSPDLQIRLRYDYSLTVGQNFQEVLRATDSVQLSFKHNVCTPANWCNGEEVFIQPQLNTLRAAEQFAKGFLEVRPWFRVTSLPDDEGGEGSSHS